MLVQSLNVKHEPFQLQEEDENVLVIESGKLNDIGALMILFNSTRSDFAFSVTLLAMCSNSPTLRC